METTNEFEEPGDILDSEIIADAPTDEELTKIEVEDLSTEDPTEQ
jgi:hypothetical protein